MKQRYIHLVLVLSAICIHVHIADAQSNYTFHSKNVAVIGYDKFSRAGSSDVWGIKIAGTPDKHYALSTLGGGLSIALVNATSPVYYNEMAYVNHVDYDIQAQTPISYGFADIETFVVSGITFATLAIARSSANPVVYIVNVDSAIALGQTAQDNFVPISSVQTATIPSLDSGSTQAHTITIADNRLYVATQKHEIDV
ncbi:MAG: hypothetical protein M5R41_16220 [Bacteroidia bacterium]|nr:hypothetical protein [Bacteroidia bacterium]